MGYLWENMEKIDVQGTYDELVRTKKALKEEIAKVQAVQMQNVDLQKENARLRAMLEERA